MIITKYQIQTNLTRQYYFAFVSDIHNGDIELILKAIEVSRAEAILVVGDFIPDADDYERGLEFLRRAAAMRPTFCSLGNHERKYRGELVPLVLATGAVLLDNAETSYRGIRIGGLSSGYLNGEEQRNTKKTPTPNLTWLAEFAKKPGYKLLLSHHPEYYKPYIHDLPIDLTLSGHAHGGQWRFLGRGVFAPGQGFLPKYTAGLYDGRLLVGRGLGDSHAFPPRIFNKPELIFLSLTPINEKEGTTT